MALIHFGRDQYLQASRRKFSSLWPPIGSKHKLIASYSFQDCSYLALAKKKNVKSFCPFNTWLYTNYLSITWDNFRLNFFQALRFCRSPLFSESSKHAGNFINSQRYCEYKTKQVHIMTVCDTSFGIDLSHKTVKEETSHNSKTPSHGRKIDTQFSDS